AESYRKAVEAGLNVENIRPRRLEALSAAAARLTQEIDHSNTIIDMLLLSADQTTIKQDHFRKHSINQTIHQALERYPFKSDKERNLVWWNDESNFTYFGSDILVAHVIFNLTKNALHSVLSAGKGNIR